jgi:hypothetical protein
MRMKNRHPATTGKRQAARIARQIAKGQLKFKNGLRRVPVAPAVAKQRWLDDMQ